MFLINRLFRSTESNFSHNEWILSEIGYCKVEEILNDDYTVELDYPIQDTKGISPNLVVGGLISIPTIDSREDQLFRIIAKSTSLRNITVKAQAKLLADLKVNRVRAMTLTGLTRKQAIQTILNAALEPHTYTVGNLDTSTNTNVIVNVQEGNLLSAIIGSENSVLSEYGGEFIINNNTIDIVDSRGKDNGVIIQYGKNLSSIQEQINNLDLATVLIPKSGDYRLPEYSVESPRINEYEKRYFKEVDLNLNIWDGTGEKKEDQVTEAEAYTLMRQTCNKMFAVDKVDQISFNYSVNFVQLSRTEEYKNYAILETINLGDTVIVKHKKLNLDLEGKVNKIGYTVNSLGVTTISTVEIGFKCKDLTDIIKTAVKSIKFTKDEILLSVNNSVTHVTAEFKIADDAIKQSVTDLANSTTAALTLQANKISAVVESNDGGASWTLSKSAFIVACKGASNSNTVIDGSGLTVNNGKIAVRNNSGKTVFYVNTSGKCNADGGFIIDDGNSTYKLDKNGLTMTNENGYTSKIYVADNATEIVADDDFTVMGTLRTRNTFRTYGYVNFDNSNNSVDFDNDDINIGSRTLKEYIENVVNNM